MPTLEGQSNVVVNVNWNLSGTDGTNTSTIVGKTPITYVAGSAFTEFQSLTETQVIEWVQSILSIVGVNSLKQAIQSQIDSFKNAAIIESAQPLPWAITKS